MLENIVAWVLNNYIGEYLEDLNTDQLSVALLSGQVELENVPLKKTALRKLDLPLEVKAGLLGKLTLSVPITHLRSEPWALKLSDVLIIVGPPTPDRRYDVEAVERVEQQKKEQMLDELEKRHTSELSSFLGLTVPASQDTWWGASLISTVLNNIQLILNNVHIRYEDNLSLPNGLVFNCGIRIQTMTMQTTNAAGKPGFVEPQTGVNIFKKLELKGFSLYWNSDQKLSKNIDTPKNLRDILAPEDPNCAFIIHPCSAELRMERNSSKFPLKGHTPRFKFFLRPEKITVEMTRRQMAELRALNREWARFERARQHRKWRPLMHIGENAAAWWRFAYDRVSDDARRVQSRRSWHFALTRARHLNAYCRAYRRRLLALIAEPTLRTSIDHTEEDRTPPSGSPVKASSPTHGMHEDVTIMKQIEHDSQYSYHELHLFRETVFRRIMREKAKEKGVDTSMTNDEAFENIDSPVEEIPSADILRSVHKEDGGGLYGWITSFFTQEENKVEKDEAFDFGKLDLNEFKDLPKSFNVKEMEEEILDVLHESWDDSTLLRRDMLLAEIAMRLEHMTLRFIDTVKLEQTEQRRVLAMDLTGVTSRVELSPRQHSLMVSLAVHDMGIQRLRTGHPPPKDGRSYDDLDQSFMFSLAESTKILLAVGRKDSVDENPDPMFRMLYRRRSPRLTVRHNIEGSFRPVSVMYEENALAGLSSLFADDPNMFTSSTNLPADIDFPNAEQISTIESHVFVNLHIPSVTMELRRRGWGEQRRSSPEWEAGDPFACLTVHNVSMGYVTREAHVSKVKLGIGHLELADLMERTPYPLLSTGKGMYGLPKTLSASCPDLSQAPITETNISSSLPTRSFLENLPSVHTSRKISTAGDGRRQPEEKEATILITFVDSKHPQFESKYMKKNYDVDIELNELDMGMNRRTWTGLLDLAGLLGIEEVEDDITEKPEADQGIVETAKRDTYPA
ncbi:hypothetical protein Y032_0687g1538 [Ancylostoma ceylanicum]|uniref:Chorein N-terminal domain-containing protein n=1 Tax=Ancylostoma ceylanicum TaxID=53326 RepID=A0A016WH21_9BILA|nr:hypothetical protein Y032_0687g1538 [Ancylostoma ceylanicum]